MANTEVERHTGVDVEDVPSANWGWSKQNHRAIQIGGILAGFFMLAMLRGNQVGHVEDMYGGNAIAGTVNAVPKVWMWRRTAQPDRLLVCECLVEIV